MRNTFTSQNFRRRPNRFENCGFFCRIIKSISAFFQKINPFKSKENSNERFYRSYPNNRMDSASRFNNNSPRSENFRSENQGGKKFNFDKKKLFIKLTKICGILALVGFLFIVGVFIYFAQDLPDPSKVNSRNINESTKIYDRTGNVILYDIHGEEKRTLISSSEIPDNVKKAIIALEDHNFYSHWGFDVKGLINAVLGQIGIRRQRGGSTITQQFVKNALLTNEKSYARKIKELILSVEIEMKFDKDQIIGMYLNEISFGSNAYGIEAAAQTYFNKHAKDLTLDEATLLVSIPQSPTKLSPFGTHLEELKARQETSLNEMVNLGYISQEEADNAKNVDVFSKLSKRKENIKAPHFVFYVQDYLTDELGYTDEDLEKNGLKVVTTLDYERQEKSEAIVKEIAESNEIKYKASNAAAVVIDPKNGDILTMVGSRDYFGESTPEGCVPGKDCKFDGNVNVTIRDRQPGSSFKPYAYLKAFEKGYTPETIVFDVETSFDAEIEGEDSYKPKNYDGTFRGPVKLKEALAMSLNIPAVKVLYLAGQKDVIAFAKRLGITSLSDPERYGLSVVLGGGEVKLLDHTAAYSVFANEGIKFNKRSILRIEDKDGKIIYEAPKVEGERVVDEKYVNMLSHALSNNKYRVPTFGENNPLKFDDDLVAIKTGTTNFNKDAWTMGYTPKITIGVWAGNNDNSSMTDRSGGSTTAAPIFRRILTEVYSDYLGEKFPKYDKDEYKTKKDILDGDLPEPEKIKVCEIPGKKDKYCKANKYCPSDKEKTRYFADIHNILYYVKKDDPQGDKPDKPKDDPQYKNWEKAVKEYYEKDNKTIFEEEPDDCKEEDFSKYKPEIELSVPESVTELKVKLKSNINSPYDIDKIEYFADGNLINSGKNKNYEYDVPNSDNGKDIEFKVVITDSVGNQAEDTKKTKINAS